MRDAKTYLELVRSDVAAGATNTLRPLTQPIRLHRMEGSMEPTDTPEEWRPVLGFEGLYEVSNTGLVRSLDRPKAVHDGQVRRGLKGRVLRAHPVRAYLGVHLMVGKQHRKAYVHILVCEAFHGPRPQPDWEVRHLNGIASDNRPENLQWGTASENKLDTVRHGTHVSVRKKVCPRGHMYDRQDKSGGRRCSICHRENGRNYWLKNREKVLAQQRQLYSERRDSERAAVARTKEVS